MGLCIIINYTINCTRSYCTASRSNNPPDNGFCFVCISSCWFKSFRRSGSTNALRTDLEILPHVDATRCLLCALDKPPHTDQAITVALNLILINTILPKHLSCISKHLGLHLVHTWSCCGPGVPEQCRSEPRLKHSALHFWILLHHGIKHTFRAEALWTTTQVLLQPQVQTRPFSHAVSISLPLSPVTSIT